MKTIIYRSIVFCMIGMGGVISWADRLKAEEAQADRTLSPYFFIENGNPTVDHFPLKATQVRVTINGVIAEVVVSQTYQNTGSRPLNACYVFPASTRAAVHGMKMTIGEEVIVAKIKNREIAKKEYQQAKQEGKSASLLTEDRPNVFTMAVANMMPDDIVKIELRYTELLIPENGIYRFIYPTVVGPRYANDNASESLETDQWVKNPYLNEGTPTPTAFDMMVYISSAIPIQKIISPSHKIETVWEAEKQVRVLLADSENNAGNRDFILNYRLAGEVIQTGLMLYDGPDENYFLLMVQPPERVTPIDITPREYIFVVDVSGSMDGFPLNTAKTLLNDLISSLKPSDTFNVLLFAGGSTVMSETALPAIQTNIDQAVAFLDGEQGGGGTELLSAVTRALNLPRDEKVSRSIVIVTDGYISAEQDVFDEITHNAANTNVFAFGIGTSVNRYLIEGLAKVGQGEPFIVTRSGEARMKAKQFREYIDAPILTNIKIEYDGLSVYDVEPTRFTDLFANRPLIIFGKWRGAAKGRLKISGNGGKGTFRQTFQVAESQPSDHNKVLPYLWARKRIESLADFNLGHLDAEQVQEVTHLGLSYNLLTPFTSFIAVHETVRNLDQDTLDVKQPLPLPEHVTHLAVGGSVASVPEPELTIMILSLIILVWLLGTLRWIKKL